jgi:hypothetical protein
MSFLIGEGYFVWNDIKFIYDKSSLTKSLVWSYEVIDEFSLCYNDGVLTSSHLEDGFLWDYTFGENNQRFELNRYFRGGGVKFELSVWGSSLEEVLTRGFSIGKELIINRETY